MRYLVMRYFALAANLIFLCVLLYVAVAEVRTQHLLFCLTFIPPLSALAVLFSKEFLLQRKVRIARLEQELKELSR